MGKIKILMVFEQAILANPLFSNLTSNNFDVKLVHTLEEALELESDYDLLMVDMCFQSSEANLAICQVNEKIEEFLGRPYIVFNFLKKTTKRIFLYDIYREEIIQEKLRRLNLTPRVVYRRGPLLMKDSILPIIHGLMRQSSV